MGFRFANPLALLGLAAVVFTYLVARGNPWRLPRQRHRLIMGLRVALLLAIIFALAGAELQWTVGRETVLFIVDQSASVGTASPQIDDWVRRALAEKPAKTDAGVVAVGKDAMVELAPTRQPVFRGMEASVDDNYTNLAAGLRLAFGLFPDATRRRAVIVSDGRENIGRALDEAKTLAAQGVRIDVLSLSPESGPDVLVRSVTAPGALREGETFGLTVTVESTIDTSGTLRVYGDRSLISETAVDLRKGVNRFHISTRAGTAGFHSYRAVISANGDSQSANNDAGAYLRVLGPPRILIVTPRATEAANLVAALRARDVSTTVISPAEMPQTLGELGQYESVVLCNVPATDLGDQAMEQLEVAVRDLGIGLVMTGGEDSFGPGGYFKTPVERALPVYMDLRSKDEVPSLGLVLIVDKSGSMSEGQYGVAKVDLAKEAALRASEVLSGKDQIGVVAFDEAAKWVVPIKTLDDLGSIQDAIGTIRAGGGTDIYPALAQAYTALKDSPTKLRHIILMTDGMSAAGGDYAALAAQMKEARITLSTVAVGSDADQALLSQLAELGSGRYYATAEYSSIPKIFSKETILASRSYLVNRVFTPAIGADSALLRGVSEAGVPTLAGYVATSPKPTAEQVFVSDNNEPVLATWQYGLGRAVAWTPDIAGRWTSRWVGWDGFARLLANAVVWTLPTESPSAATVTTTAEGGTGRVTYELPGLATAGTTVTATVVRPDLTSFEVPLAAVAPGRYEAAFPGDAPGPYLINIVESVGGQPAGQTSAGLIVPYSQEYLPARGEADLLSQIAAASGGQVLTDPAGAFSGHAPPVRARLPLWPALLTLAALLLPVDIACRRLFFSRADLIAIWRRLARIWRRARPTETPPTALTGVEERQRERRRFRQRLSVSASADAAMPRPPETAPPPTPSTPAAPPPPAQAAPDGDRQPEAPSGGYTDRLLAAKRRTRK